MARRAVLPRSSVANPPWMYSIRPRSFYVFALLILASALATLIALGQIGRAEGESCPPDADGCAIQPTSSVTVDVGLLPGPSFDTAAAAGDPPTSSSHKHPPNGLNSGEDEHPLITDIDTATDGGDGGPQSLAPVLIKSGFLGLGAGDNAIVALRPPDPQVATGPNHVVEFVNTTGRIFDRDGNVLETFDLGDFFSVPSGDRHFDPKIIYDALSGRFFAVYVSHDSNTIGRLHLAVSDSSDTRGTWKVWIYTPTEVADLANRFPDYPAIGLTDDKVTVSYNMFDITCPGSGCSLPYRGEQTLVINKADLLASTGPRGVRFPPRIDNFTMRPVHSLTSISDQYGVHVSLSSATTLIPS